MPNELDNNHTAPLNVTFFFLDIKNKNKNQHDGILAICTLKIKCFGLYAEETFEFIFNILVI